ncbi:MAG: potassium-transporting ATPase subunit KdpA, partial [Caulobacteraceae bacterium]|nr:potassium-transporting ATPase subunit KdpA [Caulobacteraceae bacterium]
MRPRNARALHAAAFVLLYAILRLQHALPLNPQGFRPGSDHLAFGRAVSFITNTNWQSPGSETTLSRGISARWLGSRFETSCCRLPLASFLAVAFIRAFAHSR